MGGAVWNVGNNSEVLGVSFKIRGVEKILIFFPGNFFFKLWCMSLYVKYSIFNNLKLCAGNLVN